jgi:hypothetical protein
MSVRFAWIVIALVAGANSPSPSPSPSPISTPQRPSVTLSSSDLTVGSQPLLSGTGFPSNSTLAVYVDDPASYVASPTRLNEGGPQTDEQGAFQIQVTIPDEPFGTHSLCADTGYSGSSEAQAKACAPFTIQANLRLNHLHGGPGTRLVVVGTGWPAGQTVVFYPDPTGSGGPFLAKAALADGTGRLSQVIDWPTSNDAGWPADPTTAGYHRLCADTAAVGQSVAVSACALFMVDWRPAIEVTPSTGPVNTDVTIVGRGFFPSTDYTITVDATPVVCSTQAQTVQTDASGVFTTHLVIASNMFQKGCEAKQVNLPFGMIHICGHTGAMDACATFDLMSPPGATPVAGIPASAKLPGAIAAFLALIVLAALGTGLAVRRGRRRRGLPPLP